MSSEKGYVQQQIEQAADMYFTSPEAEENILHQMLNKQDIAEEIAEELSENEFSQADYRKIFHAIQSCIRKGVHAEAVNVDAEIHAQWPDEAATLIPTFTNVVVHHIQRLSAYKSVRDHVKIVHSLYIRRTAIRKFEELANGLRDPTKDINETLSLIRDEAESVDSDDVKWMKMSEVAVNTYDYLEKRSKGDIKAITSGVKAMDRLIGGFFAGELTVVAARPAVGKSAFGLNIAMSAAESGFKVGVVSCEMTDVGFGQRIMSRESWVSGEKLRKGDIDPESWDKLAYAMEGLGELPIEFMFAQDNPHGMTIENVVSSVRRKAKRGEMDLLIVDYIGILQSSRRFKEDRDRVKYISSELKRLSQVAAIPVIALCQVNRDAHGSMPTMAQLRDSGSVEQDADGIIFLHHPDNNKDASIHPDDVANFDSMNSGTAYIAVNVAKQRNGQTGLIHLVFDPSLMRYVEITRMEEQKP